jgi:phospholipid/cholesterol/gamma-HCH transport system substrate-binding protein
MNTERLNPARLFVVVAFSLTCFGLMLFLWNAFGGAVPLKPQGYRVTVALPEADLLAEQADVRISGVTVGRVVRTEPSTGAGSDANRKDAIVEIEARYAPLRRDVRATIRHKSLAGEEYLELSPGGPDAAAVADGGRLASANVAPSVEIDELLRTFDAPTRRALENWIQTQAQALGDRGADLNQALGTLPAFEQDLTAVLVTLNRQQGAVRAAVANTGVVFDALSAREEQLRGAIVNGERATGALAAGSDALADAFRALPRFEAESRTLLARVDRFRRNADPVLSALRPGVRALSAAAQELPATAPELNALVHGVADVTPAARRGLPATTRFLDATRPFVGAFGPFLDQLQPVLAYITPQASSLNTLIAGLTAATQATTSGYGGVGEPLHYARVGMTLNPGSLALYPERQSWSRANAYDSTGTTLGVGRPLSVFDDANCTSAIAFPKLSTTTAGGFSAELLQRIEHYVLNDGQAAAPPCRLMQTPQGGQRFPHITPLSHAPGGDR